MLRLSHVQVRALQELYQAEHLSLIHISKTGRIDLKKVMSGENGAERVKNYSIPMAEGLVYNLSLIHI